MKTTKHDQKYTCYVFSHLARPIMIIWKQVPTNWSHLEMTKAKLLTKYHRVEPAGSNISDPRLYSVKQQELALK